MNDNELNNISSEENPVSIEERKDYSSNVDPDTESPFSDPDGENEPQEGFTFKWINLLIGGAILLAIGNHFFTGDWTFYLYLSIVVIIHELGHVIVGKSFGCLIKEVQVFFLPFVSYKPEQELEGSSWRNIAWSLGVLPLGGVTVFKSRNSDDKNDVDGMEIGNSMFGQKSAISPYIEDKAAWQRLLISAAGVLFNILTFLIIYVTLPYMSYEGEMLFQPLAFLSLLLVVLNILPIYPLDGGAMVFALYEMITGKKPSPRFTNACSWIGFIFIVLFFWVFPEWLAGLVGHVFSFFF